MCDFLVTDIDGIYIDGTLGGGGHSEEILRRLSNKGKLFSFDKDSEAISYCQKKFENELSLGDESRLKLVNDCFSKACSIKEIQGRVQGLLLDLGLSSRQLDNESRGFSYRTNSKLDMKFGSFGLSAEDLLNASKEEELARILRVYGEEPNALTIARRIVQRRRASPLLYTFDLRSVIEESVPPSHLIKTLSRVFQAIRIAVNNELETLFATLSNCMPIYKNSARIVIISYHSLEDRIVKIFFKDNSQALKDKNKINNYDQTLNILTKKPILPSEDEINRNFRARSAKLRVAEVVKLD